MIIKIQQPLVINPLDSHNYLKDKLLDAIKECEARNIVYGTSNITKTDYEVPGYKLYQDILKPYIVPHMQMQMNSIGYDHIEIHNMWFQQYATGGSHSWHVHHKCQWTNVYYLQLDENNPKTIIWDNLHKITREVPVYEGAVLTMPSQLIHKAPENLSNTTKTIISFNSCTPLLYEPIY